jgi:hypothetical protein
MAKLSRFKFNISNYLASSTPTVMPAVSIVPNAPSIDVLTPRVARMSADILKSPFVYKAPHFGESIAKGDEPDPEALVDDNSIIYLNSDIHDDMHYVPLQRSQNEDLDYVLLEAYSGNKRIGSVSVSISDPIITVKGDQVSIDVLSLVRDKLGLGNGQYDIRVCFYRNYIYGEEDTSDTGKVQVEEISPSRYEIRVKASLPKYYNSLEDWGSVSPKQDEFNYDVIWPAILKDSSRQLNILSTNWTSLTYEEDALGQDHIIFRLTEPLPRNVKVGNQFQITRDIISPYVIPVVVDLESSVADEFNQLRGPNFKAIDIKDKPARETKFETWDSIIGTDTLTKQRIIDKYISGSDNSLLNIDHRKYDNFVHFSSAEERIKNFKYKLELIEYYTSQSNVVSVDQSGKDETAATGSIEFLQNKASYDSKKTGIISGFDEYEKYLYYESHSTEETTYGTFPAATWPKSTSTKPHTLVSTTGSEAITWYASQLVTASLYDDTNVNILRNTIPQHILQDGNSDSYVLFVDMVGQHFDTIYNYISQIPNVVDREESIYDGMSKDLIYDTAKSFGWSLQSGFDTSKLWEYVLGTDETGSYSTSTNEVRAESYSHEDIEKQTWKRIVNNIPYLLKTKGTARGIKALLNTYGIPNTILQIQEYGGPVPTRPLNTRREIEKFSYALDFSGSRCIATSHSVIDVDKPGSDFTNTDADRYTSMYEFRFDTSTTQSMHLVSAEETSSINGGIGGVGKFEVILEHSSSASATSSYSKYGRLQFKITSGSGAETTMSTDYAPFYDNDWWNVSFGTQEYITGPSDTKRSVFEIRYAKIGEHADDITHSGSTTFTIPTAVATKKYYNGTWGHSGRMLWGGTGSGDSTATYNGFVGSMQEVRGWAEHISEKSFHQHALSPISITGDTVQMAYNDLIMRHPLGTNNKKYNHSTTTSLTVTESIPNTLYAAPFTTAAHTTDATFIGWPDAVSYSNKSETYYVNVPNTIGATANDSKIRIEDNKLRVDQLSSDKSFEVSSFDSNPLDTEQITVAFSPQDQIDIDIAMQFGGFSLDDYIGDPRDRFSTKYTSLRDIQNLYYKKYDDRYNIWAFIRMLKYLNTGFFKQIEALLPARADAVVGVLIRPSMLERSKVKDIGVVSLTSNNYYGTISEPVSGISGRSLSQRYNNTDFLTYTTTINMIKSSSALPQIDLIDKYTSGSQSTFSTGLTRLIRTGTRVSSTDFNTPSADTIDGSPVVEFILTNPNRLYSTDILSGNDGGNTPGMPAGGDLIVR